MANWKGDSGISLVEFSRFSLVDINKTPRAKWKVLLETFKKFRVDLEVLPYKKGSKNPVRKKDAEKYPPYTSRYITSYKVISGDIWWCNIRWRNFWSLSVTSQSSQILLKCQPDSIWYTIERGSDIAKQISPNVAFHFCITIKLTYTLVNQSLNSYLFLCFLKLSAITL